MEAVGQQSIWPDHQVWSWLHGLGYQQSQRYATFGRLSFGNAVGQLADVPAWHNAAKHLIVNAFKSMLKLNLVGSMK